MSDPRARARELLASLRSRGDVKRAGERLDREADPALRRALVEEGRARGAELPDDATTWPGKKLLRLALAREEDARVRTNPIARDESFVCAHCGADVPAHGRTARDHCPICLRSLHVDVVPGDRAAGCGGVLDPVAVALAGDRATLTYRCRKCGAERRNRVLVDGSPPDDWRKVVALAAGEQV